MTSTYEILGSYYIPSERGFESRNAADAAVRARRPSAVAVEWDDGSIAYYADQEDADRDDTGAYALALVSEIEEV